MEAINISERFKKGREVVKFAYDSTIQLSAGVVVGATVVALTDAALQAAPTPVKIAGKVGCYFIGLAVGKAAVDAGSEMFCAVYDTIGHLDYKIQSMKAEKEEGVDEVILVEFEG